MTLDASVFVSMYAKEKNSPVSIQLWEILATNSQKLIQPSLTLLEITSALERQRIVTQLIKKYIDEIINSSQINFTAIDGLLIQNAIRIATIYKTRSLDSIYLATSDIFNSQLVTWDQEQLRYEKAITPTEYLATK